MLFSTFGKIPNINNMNVKTWLVLFLLNTIISFSQKFNSHEIALTPTVFPTSTFDKEDYKARLYKKFANESKSEILDRYIAEEAIATEYFFASSEIYDNWPVGTGYVKQVFKQAIPKEFNTDEIKIYVVRDPSPNAYCMEDGNIKVTVGFLSFIKSEAELASVLSHEFGHYYSNHIYNEYKKRNKVAHVYTRGSIIASVAYAKNLSNFQQDQERQADTFSNNFFTRNGYSPQAIAESFLNFKQITSKYKKLRTYRTPLAYFSTHPSDDERIRKAQEAFKNKDISGKKYLVDSLSFLALKKRAIDETIYLLFEKLEYDECLEMAYLQHLYHPKDEFYLFYITECLRRQMKLKPGFDKAFFITGNYVNLTRAPKDIEKEPVFLKGKYSKKLNAFNYTQSVFANLKGEVYNLSDADIAGMQAKDLVTNDTLEFLFNEDAFEYFSKKIPEESCIFNLHNLFLDKPVLADCEKNIGNSELENDYNRIIADYKMLEQNVSDYKKAPVILFSLLTYTHYASGNKSITAPIYDEVLRQELIEQYWKIALEYPNDVIDLANKFNFREKQKIRNTTQFIETLGLAGFFGKSEVDCDFLSIFPEISHEINKFNYRKLIFLQIIATNVTNPEGKRKSKGLFGNMMNAGTEGWGATIYTVDLLNKKIESSEVGLDLMDIMSSITAKREEKIRGIIDACLKAASK